MNREIKFRIFSKASKSMVFTTDTSPIIEMGITRTGCIANAWSQGGEWLFEICEPVFMQYTGIKDTKENEVYEGDIITAFSGRKYIVKFDNLAFSLYSVEYKDMRWGNLFRLFEMNDDFEVIGNIYENAELLN